MRPLFSKRVTCRRQSHLASVRSMLRGLIEGLILLYLPPGAGALLAQAASAFALHFAAFARGPGAVTQLAARSPALRR